jgi:hypothetical protein
MFIPQVRAEGEVVYFTVDSTIYSTEQSIDLQAGKILKIEQHGQTVYVKGTELNFIMVHVGYPESMKALHEYSHEIPTWMKNDFNRFLSE